MKRGLFIFVLLLFANFVFAAERLIYKAETVATPGVQATILAWRDGDETDKLIGKRNWAIHRHKEETHLYIAVSVPELVAIKDRLYKKYSVGWPWASALEDGLVTSVWYDRNEEPFYALRADKFHIFKFDIDKIHNGRLPKQIVR